MASNQAELKFSKITQYPSDLQQLVAGKEANDVTFYRITIENEQSSQATISISVKETYKRRKDPFPSTIAIRDEQLVKFTDSKYYLSVYPSKSQRTQIVYNTHNTMYA